MAVSMAVRGDWVLGGVVSFAHDWIRSVDEAPIAGSNADHTGNLRPVLDACPNATLVANWAITEHRSGFRIVRESSSIPPPAQPDQVFLDALLTSTRQLNRRFGFRRGVTG